MSGQVQKMKRRFVICDSWDVVVVPFPFIEKGATKRRPALVVSKRTFNKAGHSVLAMITTKAHPKWPGDTELSEYAEAGLHMRCIVRLKIFTLDNRLILKRIGHLSKVDAKNVKHNKILHIA